MDTSMSQNSENDCQNNQANRDINITNNYGDSEDQEFINYKIISEIFDFLFKSNLPEIDSGNLENTNSLIHLKEKIPLNFPNDGEKDVEEMFTQLWNKKSLVEKYVKEENDDSEKIDGLILKFREYFIKLKKSKSHETEVEDISIFYAPRLIELCFQTAGIWEMGNKARMGLPYHIDRVVVRKDVDGKNGRLHAIVNPGSNGNFDANVVDTNGNIFVTLEGYRTSELPSPLDQELLSPLSNAMAETKPAKKSTKNKKK